MEDIITVKNLAYAYPDLDGQKGTRVFENLNLTIESGSFVAILGTNGCGKSTLAKHFNSILLPSGGKVQEAASALAVLGYSSQEISAALKGVDAALPVEEIIRQTLKKMVK